MPPLFLPPVDLWSCIEFCWSPAQSHPTHNNKGDCNLTNSGWGTDVWANVITETFRLPTLGSSVCVAWRRAPLPVVESSSSPLLDPGGSTTFRHLMLASVFRLRTCWNTKEWKHNASIVTDRSKQNDVDKVFGFYQYECKSVF